MSSITPDQVDFYQKERVSSPLQAGTDAGPISATQDPV